VLCFDSPLGNWRSSTNAVNTALVDMLEMHDASSLESAEEVPHWRGKQTVSPFPLRQTSQSVSSHCRKEEQTKDTIEQVILRRGSTRTFDGTASITLAQLSTIFDRATRGLPTDFLEPPGEQVNDLSLDRAFAAEGSSGADTSSVVRGTPGSC
jgi:hypothetical protein